MCPNNTQKLTQNAHFLWIENDAIISTLSHTFLEIIQMLFLLSIDTEIIFKYFHEIIKILFKNMNNYFLKSNWSIA